MTFEGPEGAGKSTVIRALAARLRRASRRVLVTQEPGGSALGRAIRRALLDGRAILPLAELFLYQADRTQHVAEVVRPALRRRAVVLCDRYADASVVYQGIARGLGADRVDRLNRMATDGLRPDLTVVVDVPARVGLGRVRRRGRPNRLDREALAFHEKVRRGYLALARREPRRVKVVDGTRSPDEVVREVWNHVAKVVRAA